MVINNQLRVAVAILKCIAEHDGEDLICADVIAERLDLSDSYTEKFVRKLRIAGLIDSFRGPSGGYLLSRSANKISIADIYDAMLLPDEQKEMLEISCLTLNKKIIAFLSDLQLADIY